MFTRIALVAATTAALGTSLLASPVAQAAGGPTVIVNRSSHGVMTTVIQRGAAPLHAVRSSSVSCTGTPVARLRAKNVDGRVGGEVDLYWRPKTSGGTMVACVRHVGPTWNDRMMTEVDIEAAKTATSRPMVSIASVGKYSRIGGPVAVGGLRLKGSAVRVHAAVGPFSVTSPVIIPSQAN